MTFREHPQRPILETCDLWDTDYIYDNWEQQSQHSWCPLNKEWQGQHSQFLRCFYWASSKRMIKRMTMTMIMTMGTTMRKTMRMLHLMDKGVPRWCMSCLEFHGESPMVIIIKINVFIICLHSVIQENKSCLEWVFGNPQVWYIWMKLTLVVALLPTYPQVECSMLRDKLSEVLLLQLI